jgi:4-diphosphocytidyl-2-C-methyl-D-erythritol kinase
MLVFPGTKINLGLTITHRLKSGYHALESVFYPLRFSDVLEVVPTQAKETTFHFSGIPIPGELEDNLVFKAWDLIEKKHAIKPVSIHLYKRIPMGAGLGGGSADAAGAIHALNSLFRLDLPLEKQLDYAQRLGADCPFFLLRTPSYATGIGEILEPINLNLKGYKILLIMPGIHVSTKDAFGGIQPKPIKPSPRDIIDNPPNYWKKRLRNAFERSVFEKFPVLHSIKNEIYDLGACYASMTGSGSCIYGIFENEIPKLSEKLSAFPHHVETL